MYGTPAVLPAAGVVSPYGPPVYAVGMPGMVGVAPFIPGVGLVPMGPYPGLQPFVSGPHPPLYPPPPASSQGVKRQFSETRQHQQPYYTAEHHNAPRYPQHEPHQQEEQQRSGYSRHQRNGHVDHRGRGDDNRAEYYSGRAYSHTRPQPTADYHSHELQAPQPGTIFRPNGTGYYSAAYAHATREDDRRGIDQYRKVQEGAPRGTYRDRDESDRGAYNRGYEQRRSEGGYQPQRTGESVRSIASSVAGSNCGSPRRDFGPHGFEHQWWQLSAYELPGVFPRGTYRSSAGMMYSAMCSEIEEVVEGMTPGQEELRDKQQVLQQLDKAMKMTWPNYRHIQLLPFGSYVSGLGGRSSDLDVVIVGIHAPMPGQGYYSKDERKLVARQLDHYVRALRKCMTIRMANHGRSDGIIIIRSARIPIVRATSESGVSFDVSLCDTAGPRAAAYLRDKVRQYAPLRPLVLVLKAYLKAEQLNEVNTGGLSSYALTYMALAHLMEEERSKSDMWDVGQLLHSFFRRYAASHFNTSKTAVSVRDGGFVPMHSLHMTGVSLHYDRITVIDPLTGRNVSEGSFNSPAVLQCFDRANSYLDAWAAKLARAEQPSSSNGGGGDGAGPSQPQQPEGGADGASGSRSAGSGAGPLTTPSGDPITIIQPLITAITDADAEDVDDDFGDEAYDAYDESSIATSPMKGQLQQQQGGPGRGAGAGASGVVVHGSGYVNGVVLDDQEQGRAAATAGVANAFDAPVSYGDGDGQVQGQGHNRLLQAVLSGGAGSSGSGRRVMPRSSSTTSAASAEGASKHPIRLLRGTQSARAASFNASAAVGTASSGALRPSPLSGGPTVNDRTGSSSDQLHFMSYPPHPGAQQQQKDGVAFKKAKSLPQSLERGSAAGAGTGGAGIEASGGIEASALAASSFTAAGDAASQGPSETLQLPTAVAATVDASLLGDAPAPAVAVAEHADSREGSGVSRRDGAVSPMVTLVAAAASDDLGEELHEQDFIPLVG